MLDREKVIKGLEREIARTDLEWLDCVEVGLLRDALALLKEQERDIADMRNDLQDTLAENLRLSDLLKVQEPDEDWISRKRLRDEIQYYIEEAGWGEEVNKVLGWCLEFIDNQMAVKWE